MQRLLARAAARVSEHRWVNARAIAVLEALDGWGERRPTGHIGEKSERVEGRVRKRFFVRPTLDGTSRITLPPPLAASNVEAGCCRLLSRLLLPNPLAQCTVIPTLLPFYIYNTQTHANSSGEYGAKRDSVCVTRQRAKKDR